MASPNPHPCHAHLPSGEPPAPKPEPDKLPQNDPLRPDTLPPIKEPDMPVPKADSFRSLNSIRGNSAHISDQAE